MTQNPYYFPPSTSNIINLPFTQKNIVVDTSNWPHMRNLMTRQSENPEDDKFNWLYWCGIADDNAYVNFVTEYEKTSNYAKYFKYNQDHTNIDEIKKKVNRYVTDSLKNKILMESINTINGDMERTSLYRGGPRPSKKQQNIMFRVLFTIYINKYHQNLWYMQGESTLLFKLYDIAESIDPANPEPPLYLLFETLLFKCDIKRCFYPCVHIDIGGRTVYLYNNKELNPKYFLGFFLVTMFIKICRENFANLFKLKKSYRNAYFSTACTSWTKNLFELNSIPFNKTSIEQYKIIIGNVIVKKDIRLYLAYLLSFWKAYFPKAILFDSNEDIPSNNPTDDALIFVANIKKDGINVYNNRIDVAEYRKLKNFLTKQKKMINLVKIAKRNFKPAKQSNQNPKFTFPSGFFRLSMKGGRTRKKYKNSRKFTIKNINI